MYFSRLSPHPSNDTLDSWVGISVQIPLHMPNLTRSAPVSYHFYFPSTDSGALSVYTLPMNIHPRSLKTPVACL